ncbi:MAG: penicillin-binding protein 2, partial [Actinomycetota bacterium]|nr:penicillin-binding protein 2 [Actinomycetota bacterium]
MIPASRPRLIALYVAVFALLAGLALRIWDIQVKNAPVYRALASSERIREVVTPPTRGSIVDDLGAPIVTSRPALVISVSLPALWQQSDGGLAVLGRLATLLHIKQSVMRDDVRLCTVGVRPPCWAGSPYQPVPVAE